MPLFRASEQRHERRSTGSLRVNKSVPIFCSPTSSAPLDSSTCSTMPLAARSPVRRSARRPPHRPSTCYASRKTSRPPGSACPAPTSKTSHSLNASNATTVPTPSTTWIRLIGRPPVMASTFLSRTTSGWPTSCAAAKAK